VRLEWDEKKARTNRAKHGVSFAQAITAFDDPNALIAADPVHSTLGEHRQWLIGEADTGIVVVVFTIRELGSVYRIISARPAGRQERKRYDQAKRIPL
jgi:uncharacterized DUF497 family protein